MGTRCNCWLGDPGATCGSSEVRMRCPVHGDHVAVMTPPTPDLTALERMARNLIGHPTVGYVMTESTAQAILALCETVRAQQAALEGQPVLLTEWQQLQAAHDAAVARAEQAERERDALMVRVDQWRRMADREVTACVEMRAERDAARAELDEWQRKFFAEQKDAVAHAQTANSLDEEVQRLISALTEARRVLRLVMYDTPCTLSSCHRCVATRAEVAAVLAQEETR